MKKIVMLFMVMALIMPTMASAALIDTVRGKILLQVEANGEAWYVEPAGGIRYYMGRPDDAFGLMRKLGLGITNDDLAQLPIGYLALSGDDKDKDGLSDIFEDSQKTSNTSTDTDADGKDDKSEIINNTDPTKAGADVKKINRTLQRNLSGKILLQVQDHGEAWYLNPADGKRYFLGRPADAFSIMRQLGLGISTANLNTIPARTLMEKVTMTGYFSINVPYNLTNSEYLEEIMYNALMDSEAFSKISVAAYARAEELPVLSISRLTATESLTLTELLASITEDADVASTPEHTVINGFPALTKIEHLLDDGQGMQFIVFVQIEPDVFYLIDFLINTSDRELYNDVFYNEILASLQILE